MVDGARLEGGAEAVVDIDHRYPARAGVQHGQQGRHAAERGPVAHRGGHRDHGARHQAAHHARQSALHAGHGDDAAGAVQLVGAIEQPMDARHPHVVEAHHLVAEELGRKRSLLGHGKIARARRGHAEHAITVGSGHIAEHEQARLLVIGHGHPLPQGRRQRRGRPVALRRPAHIHSRGLLRLYPRGPRRKLPRRPPAAPPGRNRDERTACRRQPSQGPQALPSIERRADRPGGRLFTVPYNKCWSWLHVQRRPEGPWKIRKRRLVLGTQGALAVGHDLVVVLDLVLQAL